MPTLNVITSCAVFLTDVAVVIMLLLQMFCTTYLLSDQ